MKQKYLSSLVATMFVGALTACGGGDDSGGSSPLNSLAVNKVALINSGPLQGSAEAGVMSFKGIPYAAPPVGALRWRPPQEPTAWTGVRSAGSYGHDCMQKPYKGDAAPSPVGTEPSEDCLVLNVWRPDEVTPKKLPVMVWIYGGGFVNGSSAAPVYDGSKFAKQGVVLVSFNYRLGRFGFFGHPALSKENPTGPLGNYAFMDQIEALKWVKRNIEAFGGDANNVTIFGESAGGWSVNTLMTSPLAKGLFHKAIAQSGGGRNGIVPGRRLRETGPNGLPSAEQVGVTFANSLGVAGEDASALAALRALPADKIVAGLNLMNVFDPTFASAMIDGQIVVDEPGNIFRSGQANKVPYMVGATNMDLSFSSAKTMDEAYAPFGPANRQAAEAAFNPLGTGNVSEVVARIASDMMMVEPARFVAQTLSAQGVPVYEYRFSYVATAARSQFSGAVHASELPFVFDTLNARYGASVTPQDAQTAKLANDYWVSFAKTGNPNGVGRPEWQAYDTKSDSLLEFSPDGAEKTRSVPDSWKARLDLIQKLY